ncbi:type IV secretory system conjugative DNA transfer family protein [Solibacillus sp. NPDC093137]|uniref:type IV secretory system conjugative DNA transfer family protein n=1 Tax=Solibacillus sp. NPDC093137 TaxID=3390678 RepID=UPI003D0678EA
MKQSEQQEKLKGNKANSKLPQLTEQQKKNLKKRLPITIVSVLQLITLYFTAWSFVKIVSLMVGHYYGEQVYYLPSLFFKFNNVDMWFIPIVAVVSIYGWLLSTRVVRFKKPKWRVVLFWNAILSNAFTLIAFGMSQLQKNFLPFFYERLNRVIYTDDVLDEILFQQVQGFFFTVMLIPLILFGFLFMFLMTKYRKHDADLIKAFYQFEWTGERLRKFENIGKTEDVIIEYPDIELGMNKKTNEMVVLPGFDRSLNTMITGSIGTGKTAALGLPIINQDLHYITRFINAYPTIREDENYISEEIQGRFMNGLSIVEPSNDLCQKVYKLAKAHGIPDEAITYIDPTNPNTPSINFMRGPVDKVAEVFAQVMQGINDNGGGGNPFFEQAQRNHLKQFIYLLKLHDPEVEATFDMLKEMYNDTNVVHEMHLKLKIQIDREYGNGKQIDRKLERDRYNFFIILKNLDKWFDTVIVPKEERGPQGNQKVYNDDGALVYVDTQESYVQGLRNLLSDIGANPLLSRVLNGHSDFDFDAHMGREGGILLVNTAKGQLEGLSPVLGKLVLMSLQNAAFRREPNVSTFHHILIDEAPEYLYSNFATFPTQSRKFKVMLTLLQQTLTQLRGAFGEDYMNTVVAAMRNRMVYADVSSFDGKYFSDMFGEVDEFEEGESENAVSPLQDSPESRSGSSYKKTRKAAMSSGDILFQEAFECAVKIVVNNKSMPVQRIQANFVPKDEFKEAVIKVDPAAANVWIENRYAEPTEEMIVEDTDDAVLDTVVDAELPPVAAVEENTKSVENAEVDKTINITQPAYPKPTPVVSVPKPKKRAPQSPVQTIVVFDEESEKPKMRPKAEQPIEEMKSPVEQTMPQKPVPTKVVETAPLGELATGSAKSNSTAAPTATLTQEAQPLDTVSITTTATIPNDEGLPEVSIGRKKVKAEQPTAPVVEESPVQIEQDGAAPAPKENEPVIETAPVVKKKRSLSQSTEVYKEAELDEATKNFAKELQDGLDSRRS